MKSLVITIELVYEHMDTDVQVSENWVSDYILTNVPLIIYSADGDEVYEHAFSTVKGVKEIDS